MTNEFHGFRYHTLLSALHDAANNYVETREKLKRDALTEKSPLIHDYESYLLKLDHDIEKAKKDLLIYDSALKAVASPKPALGLVTFIQISSDNKDETKEFIIAPAFDEPLFESCFAKEWRFLFKLGRVKFSEFDVRNLKNGFSWGGGLRDSVGGEYRTSQFKVKSVVGFGKLTSKN